MTLRGAWFVLAFTLLGYRAEGQGAALRVTLADGRRLSLARAELERIAVDTVAYAGNGETPVRYLAVPLPTLLRRMQVNIDSVRGPRTTWVVVATASDGFRATFSLGELAPYLGPTRAWLATRTISGPLAPEEGPFRLLVPTDKRASRGARMVIALDIVDARPPDRAR